MFAPSNRILSAALAWLNVGTVQAALEPLGWVLVGLTAGGWLVALSRAIQLAAALGPRLRPLLLLGRGTMAPTWTSTSRRIDR